MPLLYACSSNPGKLHEFAFAARNYAAGRFSIETLPEIAAISPPPEDADSYQGNGAQKALYYSKFTDELVFADDSGLEVAALNGAPGVHSARFAGPHATGAQNNALLLAKLNGVVERRARFVTAISLARREKLIHTATGTVEGEILAQPRGGLGFGYDALFLYAPLQRTFAELEDDEKFAVSARGRAFQLLLQWLANPGRAI